MNKIDILFIICLLLLYLLPKKSEKYKYYPIIPLVIFLVAIGIRIHSKIESHKNSENIKTLNSQIVTLEKDRNTKEQKIKELEEKAKKAKLGITKFYWPSGKLREQIGNTVIVKIELLPIFEKMKSLQEQGQYRNLKTLCNEQIMKNPEWPTPYLYLGSALAKLRDIENAIVTFEYFLKIAPTEPTFKYGNFRDQAEEAIKNLKKN